MGARTRQTGLLPAILCAFLLAGCGPTAPEDSVAHAPGLRKLDPYTLEGDRHLAWGYPPIDASGLLNVVVEVPTGTSARWEVDKKTGQLVWEFKKKKPKVVRYLAYPGNYGLIPQTLLPKDLGGDGDPLDVLVLGPTVPRGSLVQARLLGVLKALDDEERDDKLIAVAPGSPMGEITDLDELTDEYPGVLEIVEIWFANYKGPGEMELQGTGDRAEAERILRAAITAYRER